MTYGVKTSWKIQWWRLCDDNFTIKKKCGLRLLEQRVVTQSACPWKKKNLLTSRIPHVPVAALRNNRYTSQQITKKIDVQNIRHNRPYRYTLTWSAQSAFENNSTHINVVCASISCSLSEHTKSRAFFEANKENRWCYLAVLYAVALLFVIIKYLIASRCRSAQRRKKRDERGTSTVHDVDTHFVYFLASERVAVGSAHASSCFYRENYLWCTIATKWCRNVKTKMPNFCFETWKETQKRTTAGFLGCGIVPAVNYTKLHWKQQSKKKKNARF